MHCPTKQMTHGEVGAGRASKLSCMLSFQLIHFFFSFSKGTRIQNLASEWLSTAFSMLKIILQVPLTAFKTDRPPSVLRQNACVS